MTKLTTHVLDTANGCPAAGIHIELRGEHADEPPLATGITNSDGRLDHPLLDDDSFEPGVYELHFHAADYYRMLGLDLAEPPFLDRVVIRFGMSAGETHYHVPLLLSPYGYSTYRGS